MSEPYYADESVTLHHGDALEVLRELPDASVDAVVTDPPYGLGFMGQKWDTYANEVGRAPAAAATFDHVGGNHNPSNSADATRTRRVESRKFGVWCDEWTAECLRVLKPGGHMLAFGGTRTWHRLACAVEDAGFEIRDSIAWLYGSGFPKSLDVSKAIDKAAGATREVVGVNPLAAKQTAKADATSLGAFAGASPDLTAPATPAARTWQGWGTALKPAHEPIVVARKPLSGTVAANVLAHGTGALNIDGCRVGLDGETPPTGSGVSMQATSTVTPYRTGDGPNVTPTSGRWPANVVLDESQAAALDEQSGETVSNVRVPSGKDDRGVSNTASQMVMRRNDTEPRGVADSGGASRYFAVIPTEENPCTDTTTPAASAPTPSATGAPDATHAPATTTSGASSVADSGVTTELPIDLMAERFRYVAKADASERPFIFRPTCECEDAWPTHTPSPARATGATTEPASSSTSKSGSATTGDSSPRATRSTTSTGTSSTTTPTTSSQSPRPTTSASTPAANSETASGGSLADSAVSSSRSASLTGISAAKGGRSTDDAARATSRAWSKTSVCGNCGAPARREAHATVKPLALMRWLVRLVTPPGGTVLEPFAGSGTTVEACLLEGFHCIAIEREADYLPLIVQRINRRRDPVAAVKSAGDDGGLFDLLDEETPA